VGIKFKVTVNLDVKRLQRNMLAEIAAEHQAIAEDSIRFFNKKIARWKNKDKFDPEVKTKPGKWFVGVSHDGKRDAGKHFTWADKGTGERGGGSAYTIAPKGPYPLRFSAPHSPKTLGIMQPAPSGPKTTIRTNVVIHPGIWPRGWTEEELDRWHKYIIPRTHEAARRGLAKR
jgi:hypothetical protein